MIEFVELSTVFTSLLRRWWLLLLTTVAGAVLGYFVSINQVPVYRATTSLFVGRPIESAQLNRFDVENSRQLAAIYGDIARRQPVLQATVQNLELDMPWSELRGQVRTNVSDQTQLLDISVDAVSPEQARVIADEIARQLILLSPTGTRDLARDEALDFTRTQLKDLRARITEGQDVIAQLELEMLDLSSKGEDVVEIQQEITTLETLIARWENTYAQMLEFINGEQPANNLEVLEPAQGGRAPIRPRTLFNTLIGIIVGFALGVGISLLLDYLDNSLKSPEDLIRYLGVRTLGAINSIKGKGLQGALIINHDSFSDAYEDYRLLRSKIQSIAMEDRAGYCMMVTSAAHSEGKSITAANLGVVMAQAGYRTVVVDANLRQPVQHEIFNLQNQTGLTYLLRSSEGDLQSQLRTTLVPNLKVLVSGPQPSNPSELLGLKSMTELLDRLRAVADIVIIDSPEAVSFADATVLSKKVDGVLLVVHAKETDRNRAVQAVTNLRDAHANLLGAVLNRVSSRRRVVLFPTTSAASDGTQTDQQLAYVDGTLN